MSALDTKWYVVQVFSHFEKKVAEQIQMELGRAGLTQFVEQILVPSEAVSEMKRGKRVVTEHSVFPGYVLMKMHLVDDVWHLIQNTPRVNGFLGPKSRPQAISQAQVDRIMAEHKEKPADGSVKPKVTFEVGENVRVMEGPFATFTGAVQEVDAEKGRLTVTVSIFGRATPVDLEYSQVEKG
jgi:transcriptional antiterminator NusG